MDWINCKCAVQINPPQICTYPYCHEGQHDLAVRFANSITPEQQAILDAAPKYEQPIIGSVYPPKLPASAPISETRMADLTPDERRALHRIVNLQYQGSETVATETDIAIWRAARAFENEACANVAWNTGMDEHKRRVGLPHDCREVGSLCATAIRERAKGLT